MPPEQSHESSAGRRHRHLSGAESENAVTVFDTVQPSIDGVADDLEKTTKINTEDNSQEYVSGVKLGLIVVSVSLACFLTVMDISVISTAIPKITDDFKSLVDVGWYGSAYNLGSAALVPLTGKMYNHFNLKIAKQSPLRVLKGLHRFLDLIGFALFAPSVIMLLLALQYGGNQFPWKSSQVIGLFCGAGLNAVVWAFWNRHKGDEGLIPTSMVKRRIVAISSLNYGLFMAVVFGGVFYLPIYFQAIKEKSAILSGVYLMPNILPQILTTILTGVLVPKVGRIPPFALFAAATTAIGSGLYGTFQPNTSTGKWIGYQILAGVGQGFGFQMPLIAIQNDTKPEHLAEATSLLVWAQYVGPTIFIVAYNTLFTFSLRSEIPKHAPNADVEAIVAAGATKFRKLVSAEDLPAILVA
ncbi:Efflux pump mlcE, partial [Colletotrichum sp. SAR11_57]